MSNQFKNLPCPALSEDIPGSERKVVAAALSDVGSGALDDAETKLEPLAALRPASGALAEFVSALVGEIEDAERRRGTISRRQRSKLSSRAQPLQRIIDRLLFRMVGLTDAEATGIEDRLARML